MLVSFTACQKESISAEIPSQLSPEDYLKSLNQSVFFQYDYQNEAAGIYYGWFVDNEGTVKSYKLQSAEAAAPFRDAGTWTPEQLRRLYNLAKETRHRLSARDLEQMVRRIRAASQGRLSERVDNSGRAGRGTFRAFLLERKTVSQENHNQGGCGSSQSSGQYSTTIVEEVKVVTLKTTGAYDQENQSEDAQAITRWLEGIAINAGF